jgi:hypothetical protein
MAIRSLKWDECIREASDAAITETLRIVQKKIPVLFINLMKICDGGRLENACFDYYDVSLGVSIVDSAACFLGFEDSDYSLLRMFENPPELFPSDVIAFAETAGGDLICFDYRAEPETADPPIVYWFHEACPEQSLSPVANNFEAFLKMLRPCVGEAEDSDSSEA